MGYYVRAFCKSSRIPTINEVLKRLSERDIHISIDEEDKEESNSKDWEKISLFYKDGNLPIVAECNRNDGTNDCLFRKEINEFLEFIGKPGFFFAKRKVIKHLEDAKYIICCQLLSDIDDDGFDANGEFLSHFVKHCQGMIHAGGEGFYEGNKIIVKLR